MSIYIRTPRKMELHTCSSRSGNFGLVGMAAEGGHRFEKIYADGACSSNRNWIYLTRENGYVFVTSFKVNTRPVINGCLARGLAGRVMVQNPVQGADGGHRISLPVEERDRVRRFQGDLPGDRDGHVRPGHGPGGNGEDGGLQRVQEGEGGDNEGHRERGGGGLTRRRRGRAHPFIVSDLSNRV